MSKKKLVGVAIVLALILLIGGMIAYFTDTDTKTNVFTIGDDIKISLVEDNWNATNAAGIHPGAKVAKDPVVKNDSTTTPAYVFLEVVMPCYVDNDTQKPLYKLLNSANQEGVNSGWTLIKTTHNTSAKTVTYVFAYGTDAAMTELAATASTVALFNNVQLDPNLTAAQKTTTSTTDIVVNAYGIQKDGFETTAPVTVFGNF